MVIFVFADAQDLRGSAMMGRRDRSRGICSIASILRRLCLEDHLVRGLLASSTCPGSIPGAGAALLPIGRLSIDPVLMIRMLVSAMLWPSARSVRLPRS